MTIDHNHKHQLMVESTFFFLDSVVGVEAPPTAYYHPSKQKVIKN
jgi:hypothetical protein